MTDVKKEEDYYIICKDGSTKLSPYGIEDTNKKRAAEGKSPIEQAYYEMILLEEIKKRKTEEQAKKTAEEAKARFISSTCDEPSAPLPNAPAPPKKWAKVATTVVRRGGKRKTRKSRRGKKSRTRRR